MIVGISTATGFGPWVVILLVTLGGLWLLAVALIAIVAGERRKVRVAELQADLKREMIGRGMSAEEIERVLAAGAAKPQSAGDRYEAVGPATCDVAVEDGLGTWQRAILLDMREDRCLVHYVGTGVDDNETVGRSRVRFPSTVAFDEAARGDWPADYNGREATVEHEGEWRPAYVLMHLDRCYVHYVGHDWSENEWVDAGRVRFPGRPVAEEKPILHEVEV